MKPAVSAPDDNNLDATLIREEPVVLNQYQDFSDLPAVQLRKGIDDEGNPWTPDILLVEGAIDEGNFPSVWASKRFAGKAFEQDFTNAKDVLEAIKPSVSAPFWVVRVENLKSTRKLLTMRLFAVPAGYEDEALAWTPIDKFLFEIESKQQTAIARQVNLDALFQAWAQRDYFREMELPTDLEAAAQNPTWIFVAALITDAELDHPENVCHCGSVQVCDATVEGLDRRDPRYPFNKIFRHSIRTTFPLLKPVGMRLYALG